MVKSNYKLALENTRAKLYRCGAKIPFPENKGNIESAMIGGLSVALMILETEMELSGMDIKSLPSNHKSLAAAKPSATTLG